MLYKFGSYVTIGKKFYNDLHCIQPICDPETENTKFQGDGPQKLSDPRSKKLQTLFPSCFPIQPLS